MPARTLGGIARSSQSAIPVLRAAQCDVAIGRHITFARATSGTRYNSAGAQVTMASGVPRINYDPVSLAVLGLLIEEQQANLILRSEDFSQNNFSDGVTAAANLLTSTVNGGSNTCYADRWATVTPSTDYTATFVLEAGTSPTSAVNLYFTTGGAFTQAYGLITWGGTPTIAISGGTGSIESVGGGRYKVSITHNSAAGNVFCVVRVYVRSQLSGNVSGETLKTWSRQLVAGVYAGSYIATTSSQATRDADDATITGAEFTARYNAAAWGAFLRFRFSYTVGTRPVLSFDDGTANNRIEVYASGTSLKLRVVTGGAQQCDTTIGTVAANTDYKLAISQEGGAFLCTLNGAAEVSATAASMPTVDRARLGRNQAGNYLNGHLHTWDAFRRTVPVRERLELTA